MFNVGEKKWNKLDAIWSRNKWETMKVSIFEVIRSLCGPFSGPHVAWGRIIFSTISGQLFIIFERFTQSF
jgi:hypothetical protein